MKLYRIELIEKNVIKDLPKGLQDIERISIGVNTEKDVIKNVNSLLKDFNEELKSGNHYIKIYNYEID